MPFWCPTREITIVNRERQQSPDICLPTQLLFGGREERKHSLLLVRSWTHTGGDIVFEQREAAVSRYR